MEDRYTVIRELRKMDEALRGDNQTRRAALVLRGAANTLELHERLKDAVRDIKDTAGDGTDLRQVKIALAKLKTLMV